MYNITVMVALVNQVTDIPLDQPLFLLIRQFDSLRFDRYFDLKLLGIYL